MKVVLSLSSEQKDLLKSIATSKLELNVDQCYAFTQYCRQYDVKYKKVARDTDNILHAHEYDKDDANVYWLILSSSFDLIDMCIPLNIDVMQTSNFSELSEEETKIVYTLKKLNLL